MDSLFFFVHNYSFFFQELNGSHFVLIFRIHLILYKCFIPCSAASFLNFIMSCTTQEKLVLEWGYSSKHWEVKFHLMKKLPCSSGPLGTCIKQLLIQQGCLLLLFCVLNLIGKPITLTGRRHYKFFEVCYRSSKETTI